MPLRAFFVVTHLFDGNEVASRDDASRKSQLRWDWHNEAPTLAFADFNDFSLIIN